MRISPRKWTKLHIYFENFSGGDILGLPYLRRGQAHSTETPSCASTVTLFSGHSRRLWLMYECLAARSKTVHYHTNGFWLCALKNIVFLCKCIEHCRPGWATNQIVTVVWCGSQSHCGPRATDRSIYYVYGGPVAPYKLMTISPAEYPQLC